MDYIESVMNKRIFTLPSALKHITIACIYFLAFALSAISPENTLMLVLLTLFLLFRLAVRWKSRQSVVLLFTFMATFVVMLLPFFAFNVRISYYQEYQNHFFFASVLRALSLFIFVLWTTAFSTSNKSLLGKRLADDLTTHQNAALHLFAFGLMFFILVFGRGGDTIFQTGGYGAGGRVTRLLNLSIYEYFLIFMPIFCIFATGRYCKTALLILSTLYILKNLSFGGRIESLQVMLMLFILFYEGKFSYKKILFYGCCIVAFLNFWGAFRGAVDRSIADVLGARIFAIYSLLDTQSEVIYSSSVYQSLRLNLLYDQIDFAQMFGLYMISIIVPSRFMPSLTYLHNTARQISPFGGGGLISAYFYTWLGYTGVILIGLVVSYFLVSLDKKQKSQSLVLYQIMVLSTYPRWFSYAPIILFKLCFYIVPVWLFFKVVLKPIFLTSSIAKKREKQ